jgi:O-antigen ligase
MTVPQKIVYYALLVFAFTVPITHVPVQFAIVFMLWGWIAQGVVYKQWEFRGHIFFLPLVFYLLWNVVAALLSGRILHCLWCILDNEWPLFIMLFMFWTITKKETLIRMIEIFLVVVSFASVYALWQTFSGYELHRGFELSPTDGMFYRSVGFYGFYLTFGLLAMTGFFISGALLLEKAKHFSFYYYYAVPILCFLAVLSTFARSLWLAMALMIPFSGFLKNRKTGWTVTVGSFFLIAVLLVSSAAIRHRAFSMFVPSENGTRIALWETSINAIEHNPVFGLGEDNFETAFARYHVPGFYDTTAHPHNDYLNVAVASGLPGLCAFVSLWIIALWVGFKTWRKSKDPFIRGISLGASISLFGFMIASFFQDYYGTFINCWLWWFVTGMIFTAYALEEKIPVIQNKI